MTLQIDSAFLQDDRILQFGLIHHKFLRIPRPVESWLPESKIRIFLLPGLIRVTEFLMHEFNVVLDNSWKTVSYFVQRFSSLLDYVWVTWVAEFVHV